MSVSILSHAELEKRILIAATGKSGPKLEQPNRRAPYGDSKYSKLGSSFRQVKFLFRPSCQAR